jgi:ketosteroid isomerase-like protein
VQEAIELPVFDVRGVFEDGDTVASRVRVRVRFRESGREVDDDEWHIWTFDGEGRVLTLRHLIDTKKHYDAWRGDPSQSPSIVASIAASTTSAYSGCRST